MFSTLAQKIALVVYIFLILSIPVGAYLASQRQTIKTDASTKTVTTETKPKISPLDEIKKLSTKSSSLKDSEAPTTPSVSFGPTLNLKLILEGRPKDKMKSQVFIGIGEGTPTNNPKYLLSFTIDLPDTGIFEGLSLAGLTSGSQYSAYIKPTVQLATASAFIMSPSVTKLNSNLPLTLLTGDLNEDNIINAADYSLAKAAIGSTSESSNWNEIIDFNKDLKINSIDIAFIIKNFLKTGDSGVWISTPLASPSASASSSGTPAGHPEGNEGYWLWVPGF